MAEPTCHTQCHGAEDGGGGAGADQLGHEARQRVQEQGGPEQPVQQGPGPAWRAHYGAREPTRLAILLLELVLEEREQNQDHEVQCIQNHKPSIEQGY